MAQPRILLTGATGFIGSEVFCRLLKKVPPENLVLLGRRKPDLLKGLLAERLTEHGLGADALAKVSFVETDFMDSARFRADLEKLDPKAAWTVVHLAAVIHAKGDHGAQERVNIGVTRELLEWSNAHAGHFVYTSSIVAFGGTDNPVIRSERDFANFPRVSRAFDYFTSKRQAHEAVVAFAKVAVTILCPGIVHGSLENYKDSRSHLKALREGRLSFAPAGGCNVVSLDQVAAAIADAALEAMPARETIRLLVDRNLSYGEYFQLYVSVARGLKAQKIRSFPGWSSVPVRWLFRALRAAGIYSSVLEGAAQGSLYLLFRSEHSQPYAPPIEDAIRRSL